MSGAALALVFVSIFLALAINALALAVIAWKLHQDYEAKQWVLRTSLESAIDMQARTIADLNSYVDDTKANLARLEDSQVAIIALIEDLKLRGNTHGDRSQYVGPNGESLNVVGAF